MQNFFIYKLKGINKKDRFMMQKILPLAAAPIETYQGTSFILSVILSYENMGNAYFNNYINIRCNNTYDSVKVNLDFTGVSGDDYREKGLAEINRYFIKNIHQDNFHGFMRERIDQENYLLFFGVDEYYLSYSEYFQKKHRLHDTYVYGYDADSFCMMAYKDRKLSRFQLPMQELLRALYCQDRPMEIISFFTFRPSHSAIEVISFEKIKQSFYEYYHSEYSGNGSQTAIYGMNTYNILIKCAETAISEFNNDAYPMDLRPFRAFWEHKKVFKDHILKMSEKIVFDRRVYGMMDEIERQSSIIFKLMIKHKLNSDVQILERVAAYLMQLKEKEERLIYLLLMALEQADVAYGRSDGSL